jgi:hypothetical protein
MYQDATEARVGDILAKIAKDSLFLGTPGKQGQVIACVGGTGVILNMDASTVPNSPGYNVPFNSAEFGKDIRDTFSDCYGREPNRKAGNKSYIRAFQYFGNGFNLLVRGAVDCKQSGF